MQKGQTDQQTCTCKINTNKMAREDLCHKEGLV